MCEYSPTTLKETRRDQILNNFYQVVGFLETVLSWKVKNEGNAKERSVKQMQNNKKQKIKKLQHWVFPGGHPSKY